VIDIHTHVLPGIDDGAEDLEESIQICKLAWQKGTRTIVVTPHIGRYDNDKEKISKTLDSLKRNLPEELSDLELYYGSDTLFSEYLPQQIKENSIVTINDTGKYLGRTEKVNSS